MGDRFCRPVYLMLYLGPEITFLYVAKSLIYLAPRAGFEPATNRLTDVSDASCCNRLQFGATAKPLNHQ